MEGTFGLRARAYKIALQSALIGGPKSTSDARLGIAGPVSYPSLRKFFHRDQEKWRVHL